MHELSVCRLCTRCMPLIPIGPTETCCSTSGGALKNSEVPALWSTQLNYGRWSLDLMAALKSDFLTALEKKETLDEEAYRSASWQFAALGIDRPDFLSDAEIRDGFHNMGAQGASFTLQLFETRLRQSDQPASQWREMIGPWLTMHWPRQEVFRTGAVLTTAAEMLFETGRAFAEALQTLEDLHLVDVVEKGHLILFRLAQAENADGREGDDGRFSYATSFPHEVCRWLDRILPPALPGYEQHYLNEVIQAIERAFEGRQVLECLRHLRERTS